MNSKDTSTFSASSSLLATSVDGRADNIGNGNASGAASLSTSSYASQANSTTASAFMQAFTGGGGHGVEAITNIKAGSTTGTFDVTTTQTATVNKSYTTDTSGNITGPGTASVQ